MADMKSTMDGTSRNSPPTWDSIWMQVAEVVAQKSDCFRAKTGCVIVSPDNRIVATGYNGPPARYPKGRETFAMIPVPTFNSPYVECVPGERRIERTTNDCRDYCPRAVNDEYSPSYDNCPSIHAESNAIAWADRSLMKSGTLYTSGWPCLTCAKLMSNCGLDRIVTRPQSDHPYRSGNDVLRMLTMSELKIDVMDSCRSMM